MTRKSTDNRLDIDEVDREILEILAEDPRGPYADIADELGNRGIEMSSEGVRQRVTSLLENMTSFFLPRPDQQGWNIVIITVWTANTPNAKRDVFEAMSEMNFWFVAEGFGTIDVYGIATVESNTEIDELLVEVREMEPVTEVNFFIETARAVDIGNYLPV